MLQHPQKQRKYIENKKWETIELVTQVYTKIFVSRKQIKKDLIPSNLTRIITMQGRGGTGKSPAAVPAEHLPAPASKAPASTSQKTSASTIKRGSAQKKYIYYK